MARSAMAYDRSSSVSFSTLDLFTAQLTISSPYVYHVHAHDLPALQAAVAAARNTPIESFIPPHMKFEHVCERTAFMVERDWRGLALDVLEDRRESGEGLVSLLSPRTDTSR